MNAIKMSGLTLPDNMWELSGIVLFWGMAKFEFQNGWGFSCTCNVEVRKIIAFLVFFNCLNRPPGRSQFTRRKTWVLVDLDVAARTQILGYFLWLFRKVVRRNPVVFGLKPLLSPCLQQYFVGGRQNVEGLVLGEKCEHFNIGTLMADAE